MDVATITGLTNIRRRKICAYATAALTNVRMVSIGTVCRSVVYGRVTLWRFSGMRVRISRRMQKK